MTSGHKTLSAVALICAAAFIFSALISDRALDRFPNSANEYAYLFQAETFRLGRLWTPTNETQQAFSITDISERDGKWVARFPPGWAMLLAGADILGIPYWLVNPLLGALLLAAFFLLAADLYNRRIAYIAVGTLAVSPFFLFNAAAYFSHVATALFGVLFYWQAIRFLRDGRTGDALLAGLFIGLAFLTRPYSAVIISLPLALYVFTTGNRRSLIHSTLLVAGALPALLFYLYYNFRITGDPLMPVTVWTDPRESLGFAHGHTPGRALEFTLRRLYGLGIWSSAAILLLFIPAWGYAIRRRLSWGVIFGSVFVLGIYGYALYWAWGGNQYGPRFYFDFYPFAVLCVAGCVFHNNWARPLQAGVKVLYAGGIVISMLMLPSLIAIEHRVITERQDLYRLVSEQQLSDAVVIVGSATSPTRRMPPGDLVRNDPDLRNSVLYVHPLNEAATARLRATYPDRRFLIYSRDTDAPSGTLAPLRVPVAANELANATYIGVMDEPVTLRDGLWQGEPFVSAGAARPTAGLVDDFAVTGDLNGDGQNETAVLLWSSSGGSGTFDFLALFDRGHEGTPLNISTVPLGDRVDVRSAAISAGELIVEVVQAGPDDAACCPGAKLRRRYALIDGALTETGVDPLGRLSIADLGGVEWQLQQFDRDESVPDGITISLLANGNAISGSSGCNRYSGRITAGERPGTFTVAMPMISTLMACPPPADELEHQYLQRLQGATGFSFSAGKLALNWRLQQDNNTHIGTMLYTARPLAADEATPE